MAAMRSYRKRLAEYARMTPLEVWYSRIHADDAVGLLPDAASKAMVRRRIAGTTGRTGSARFRCCTKRSGAPHNRLQRPSLPGRPTAYLGMPWAASISA